MTRADIEVVITSQRPDLEDQIRDAFHGEWPEFIFHDPVSNEYTGRVQRCFPHLDLTLLDRGQVVAGGWGVPLAWDQSLSGLPTGYDGALVSSVTGHETGVEPNTLVVMAAAVQVDRRAQGLASEVLAALAQRATTSGLEHVLAPARPALKSRYPLTPMDQYASWLRGDGRHLDPWIRTHQRLGASILASAPRSMVITGTVAEWEGWAEMVFPETGRYVVPGALDLVEIDRAGDRGTYVEPNLWMRHR